MLCLLVNINLPSSHQRKTIDDFSVLSCNTNSSPIIRFCYAWGSKSCVAAAKKKDHVALIYGRRREAIRHLARNCSSKLCDEEEGSLQRRAAFVEVYSVLKSELLNDLTFEWTHDSRLWVHQMLDYNVPGGKLLRGLTVIECYKSLKEGEDDVFDASVLGCVLGWCIEWFRAGLLVLEDFMVDSHTRRGQACWFRVPKVGTIAVNDRIIHLTYVATILRKHFKRKPFYDDLLDLFNEVEFRTHSGQMLDLITTIGGQKDLSNYSLDLYRRIALYKTSYYSCYLPVACALLLAGENLEKHVNVKDVLLDMGIYFQVVDDYQDCYGDPKKTGKVMS
ncbi:hypothetical protein ACS0TY_016702 [Phlomoides rotata]